MGVSPVEPQKQLEYSVLVLLWYYSGALRSAERIGRPLANKDFIDGLERVLGRAVARRAPRRKKAVVKAQSRACSSAARMGERWTCHRILTLRTGLLSLGRLERADDVLDGVCRFREERDYQSALQFLRPHKNQPYRRDIHFGI